MSHELTTAKTVWPHCLAINDCVINDCWGKTPADACAKTMDAQFGCMDEEMRRDSR